uniref:Ragulator complex protein LAMTOR1 n=1 Tax=Myotis myotis TaxID=51298 RepID=A0A7J7VHM6_MYOMY|nr:late endosomal/lysosomal adaptor, MAPK and MTOR activator 1 [Myotis myotis]
MGCCYSSENEDSDQDREERKLLLDPSSPPTKALNGAEPNYHSLPSARTDEQALLSSILAKTASNIIDVSAADSQGMEQHEYMDRARQYSTRLAVLSSSLTHWKKLPPLPSLTSQPHQVLASEPIPFSDLQQVSYPCPTPAYSLPLPKLWQRVHPLPYRRWGTGVNLVACGPCSLPPFSLASYPPSFPPLWPSDPPPPVSGSPFSPFSLCSSPPWSLYHRSPE